MRSKGEAGTPKMRQAESAVPRLRFPGFSKADAWMRKALGKFCKVNPVTDALPAEFFYIDLGSVDKGELKSRARICKDRAPSRAQRLLQVGDVLFQIVRPYQRNNLFFDRTDGDYVASTGYAQLRSSESSQFLYQLVHTDSFVDRVISKCTGSNYPAINPSDLAEIEILHPEQGEQKKVADCLSSLDVCIGAETRKLDALKAHKQGLMQQLFPVEGERLPRLRFPGFDEEWGRKRLGDLCSLVTKGTTPTTLGFQYVDEGVRFVKIESLDGHGSIHLDRTSFITEECNNALARSKLAANDILFSIAGALGLVAVVKEDVLPANTNQALAILRVRPQYLVGFVAALLGSDLVQALVRSARAGAAQPNISLGQIANFEVAIPTRDEQTRIAEFLSCLDQLINTQSRRITVLQQHKKGLMQGLFPVMEAHAP